ncbi:MULTISPECIES: MFS transporter [unclassified Arthrobacter]|uniref:MFS transporter n=1 Tax=unclassified Arthrobacter TaxID=235627 RepID=UPI0014928783|nr:MULTISPECIES: MFS transporter [unclassified Arthrobacter]MBE0010042.1 MFS transporter [Arthrobacter sp. AET 35A]NOJ63921.1 MFS transporter [Arthrobacter sp. 147(2020)]
MTGRGSSAALWLIFAQAIITQGMAFTVRPTISYQGLEIGIAPAWLGALAATYAAAPLLCALLVGQATDRFGPKKIMVVGTLLMVLSGGVLTFLGGTVTILIVGSVLLGVGHLMAVIGQQAAVAGLARPGRLQDAFGHYTLAGSLGQALGPGLIAIFGVGATIPDTGAIFAVATALMAISLVLAIVLPTPRVPVGPKDLRPASWSELLRIKGLVPAITITAIVLAAVDITLIYLPVLGAELGISAGTVGLLLSIRAASSMISRLFLGKLVRLLGSNRLLFFSLIMAALSMALIPLGMPVWGLTVLLVLLGFGLGIGQPVTMAWLAAAAPPGSQGRAMSLRIGGSRLGQIIFPTAAGAVAAGFGASGALWGIAAALGAAGYISARHPLKT